MRFWSDWTQQLLTILLLSCILIMLWFRSFIFAKSGNGLWESHFFRHDPEKYDLMRSGRWMADMCLLWPANNITCYRDIYLDTKIRGWSLQVWVGICHHEIAKTYQDTEERWIKLSGWCWMPGGGCKRTHSKRVKPEDRVFNFSNLNFKPAVTYIFRQFLPKFIISCFLVYLLLDMYRNICAIENRRK